MVLNGVSDSSSDILLEESHHQSVYIESLGAIRGSTHYNWIPGTWVCWSSIQLLIKSESIPEVRGNKFTDSVLVP